MTQCPCNSKKEFDLCCGPYLAGQDAAPTAEALMRSRYTAYTLNNFDYLIRTCHESNRPNRKDFDDDNEIDWLGLEIIAAEQGREHDDTGTVEFKASFSATGKTLSHHEKSTFVREDGQWYFLNGKAVRPEQAHSDKIGRNEPCPCGSGQKYKKCCLRK